MIKFVDGIDLMDIVLGYFVEHFKATEAIHASIEFTGKVFKCHTIVLVEFDMLA